ncbi:tetratricopeptide repeat protein [soil metagenome]
MTADPATTSDSLATDDATRSGAARGGVIAAIVIIAAIWISLWPALKCGFTVRDDNHTVAQNPDLKPPSINGVLRYWKWPAWGLYTPVTYTVWAGVALLSPQPALPGQSYELNPMHFHATNLIVHTLAALVIWLVLKRLFDSNWAACAGALLFALHPVQIDSVAWVSGLKDVLAGFFAVTAIWQYLISADESIDASDRKVHYALCIVATCAAVLSKVSAAMLPGILLLIDWLLLRRPPRQILRGVIPVFLFCLPTMIGARFIQHPESLIAFWQRPILVLFTLTFYAMKVAWPAALAPDWGLPPQVAIKVSWIWACWIIPLAVAIVLFIVRRRRPELAAGVLIFVVSILPVLGFLPFGYQIDSTVAEHYLYLAMFGAALAAAGTLARTRSPLAWAAAAIVLVALGIRSHQQTWHWRDTFTLFTHNANLTPNNWRPRNHIGLGLMERKDLKGAEEQFRRSIAIEPTHVNYGNLAGIRLAQGDIREAIEDREQAVALKPDLALTHAQLAEVYLRADRPADAEASARRALDLAPDEPRATRVLADALKRQGKR